MKHETSEKNDRRIAVSLTAPVKQPKRQNHSSLTEICTQAAPPGTANRTASPRTSHKQPHRVLRKDGLTEDPTQAAPLEVCTQSHRDLRTSSLTEVCAKGQWANRSDMVYV